MAGEPCPDFEILTVPRTWHDAHPPTARPRLRIFWDVFAVSLLVLTVLCALGTGLTVVSGMLFPGPGPTMLALGLGMLFAALVWFVVSRTLLYRGTPVRLALAAVLWGVTGGVVLGGFTSSEHLSELAVGWGTPQIAWSLAGAWPEETAKALGVVLLLFAGRTWWNRPWHGLIAGVLVGVGFEAFENALYAISLAPTHAVSDVRGVLEMWLIRLIAGPLLHALCTGIVGYAIGTALLRADLTTAQRASWIIGGWGAGFSVHTLWNLMPDWEQDSYAASVVRMAVVWIGGMSLLAMAWFRSHREARAAADAGTYPVVTVYRKRPLPVAVPGTWPGVPGAPGIPGVP
ncbi:PrsW family intramembrane metalloprotease, partial [uncultured Corynebacterium sp.]|uniref:PrsW family intramembrane metalloprotease n=1 Tax=uncultured Corynebacterium sp. TaxID=159447 RepID=UPI0025FF8663